MNPLNSSTPSAREEGSGPGGGAFTETKEKIAQTARDTAAKVTSAASNTTAKLKDQAGQMADERKESAAERLGSYSSAIHESARSLEEKDPNIAWFTHRAADRLDRFSNYIRSSDWTGLRDDCAGMARRHPAAFFGGMFLGGLVLGNILKASQSKVEESDESEMGLEPQSDWGREPAPATTPEIPTSASVPGM